MTSSAPSPSGTPPLDPEDVFLVADQLHREIADLGEDVWAECNQARLRSCVSRAYYGLFLTLKKRLIECKQLERPFPTRDAHRKLFEAVSSVLPNAGLTRKLRALGYERTRADYELVMDIDLPYVESRLDDAHTANQLADDLSDAVVTRIAKRLDAL